MLESMLDLVRYFTTKKKYLILSAFKFVFFFLSGGSAPPTPPPGLLPDTVFFLYAHTQLHSVGGLFR